MGKRKTNTLENSELKAKALQVFGSKTGYESFEDSWRLACCRLNRQSRNRKGLGV